MKTSTLINSFVQQLQQCHIVQRLPVLLDAAAEELAAMQDSPALLLNVCRDCEAGAAEPPISMLEQSVQHKLMRDAVTQLLELQDRLSDVCPAVLGSMSRVSLAAPTLRLAVAALQYYS